MEIEDIQNEVKKAVEPVMTAFEAFKEANDKRLGELQTKGSADPILTEKVAKIETSLAAYDGINQKLTLVDQQQKALKEVNGRFDAIDLKLGRIRGDVVDGEVKTSRINDWARAVVDVHTVGVMNLSDDQRKLLDDVRTEYKALSVVPDTAGGFLAPSEYVREIIKAETEISPVRSLVRVRQTAAKSIMIPKRTGQFSAVWVAEQGTKSETTGLTYGVEEIPTHEVYALIDISNQMLEDSAFSMEGEISMEASEQFAVAEGAAFVSGTGVGRPQGFLTNASVLTTNSGAATTITADGLLSLKYAIKSAYQATAAWLMARATISSVRKLKDGNGNYLWQPGLAQGRPNTLDGDPYVEVSDMPVEGAGLKPVAYGDWRRAYTWVDRIAMEMLRDPYTQATSGNVRFIVRKRVGGFVTLPEAIRVLVCST